MDVVSLTGLAAEHLPAAREASSGRSSHTVYGGSGHRLRQTLLTLTAGRGLAEHESPGEATVQVVQGRVRLRAGDEAVEGTAGDLLVIPDMRHSLDALEDAVVLLTVAMS